MSNVLIAPDKFKGTLNSHDAAQAIARGWRKVHPRDKLKLLPISDGGDGFGTVLSELIGAKEQTIRTLDAAHRPCRATWWWDARSKTAVIESAKVIGLAMLPPGKFHPFQLDTYGLGAVLHAAAKKKARRIIIGIGGSATNDGGFGMVRALGWEFLDKNGKQISEWTSLTALSRIQTPPQAVMGSAEIIVAMDVDNPLLGLRGATRIYGPQKGIRPGDIATAEACLRKLATVAGLSYVRAPGAGAAGGLGFGLMAFLSAKRLNGFDLFANQCRLDQIMKNTDLVITAEGSIDHSTLMGKGAGNLARRARKLKIPCIGLAGITLKTPATMRLFRELHALTDITTVERAKKQTAIWLERLAELAAREWKQRETLQG